MKITLGKGLAKAADNPAFAEELKQLEPDLRAFETQLGQVQHEITLLNDLGRKAKTKFLALPSVRGTRIHNLDTPHQYQASVGISNLADVSRAFGEQVSFYKSWLTAIRKEMK